MIVIIIISIISNIFFIVTAIVILWYHSLIYPRLYLFICRQLQHEAMEQKRLGELAVEEEVGKGDKKHKAKMEERDIN